MWATHGASDNMGDFHQVVIHYISEVIGREPVGLDENKVLLVLLLLVSPVNPVHEREGAPALEAHHVGLAPRRPVGRLLGGDATASAGIPC